MHICMCSAAGRSKVLSVDWPHGESLGVRVSRKDNLIWIDLEMSGLIPEQHRIIEIATVITDKELTVLAEGPVLAIHQPDDIWARWMNGTLASMRTRG